MSQAQINERMGRLALAQHEVLMGLAGLLIEVTDAVLLTSLNEEGYEGWQRKLGDMVDKTLTTIEAATLLLQEDS